MSVDLFTDSLRNVIYAIACGVALAIIVGLVTYATYPAAVRLTQRHSRPYAWSRDGECDNHSRPKVLP
jgi:hypothetical protein